MKENSGGLFPVGQSEIPVKLNSPQCQFNNLEDQIPIYNSVPEKFSFSTARISNNLLWLSGHGPNLKKKPPKFDYIGKIGQNLSADQGQIAARLVGLNLLVSAQHYLEDLNQIVQIIRVDGYINSAPGFTEQSYVMNGCTDLFYEIFGNAGKGSRTAIGVSELPFDMSVEISAVFSIK